MQSERIPLGFTEVYWAHIPRKLVDDKYSLEAVQSWVRTIIGRVRREDMAARELTDTDERMIKEVLGEMLQTINVLEAISLLARKMGLFSFDLKKVLVDFVNDVQVVTEFEEYGREIGQAFSDLMQKVQEDFGSVKEIYIVSHSEGTVVTLLGLLNALCCDDNPWISKVRGLMTLGSPIDKHIYLWPELFKSFTKPSARPAGIPPIVWHNYYDYGDPVGFELETARERFAKGAWESVFEFPPQNDHGFARYPLPGKAHNDYWKDEHVFGHFIRHVVHKAPPKSDPKKYEKAPKSKPVPRVLSWISPYVLGLAVLFCASFVLYKAVWGFLDPKFDPGTLRTFANALGLGSLLAGITVMARIPRLTRVRGWYLVGVLVFLVSLAAFRACWCWVERDAGQSFAACFTSVPAGAELVFVLAALAVVLAATIAGAFIPSLGMSTLLIPGAVATGVVVYRYYDPSKAGDLWPVFLAGALFLYLWWLAALVFDLTFVWHRYIRKSVPLFKQEKELRQQKKQEEKESKSRDRQSKLRRLLPGRTTRKAA